METVKNKLYNEEKKTDCFKMLTKNSSITSLYCTTSITYKLYVTKSMADVNVYSISTIETKLMTPHMLKPAKVGLIRHMYLRSNSSNTLALLSRRV